MKTLLVFFGIAILYIALLTFQSDGTQVSIIKAETKRISRESAAGAIQFFETGAYAQGYMVVDEAAAEQFVGDYIREQLKRPGRMDEGELEWKIEVENPAEDEGMQSVSVMTKLVYKGEDFFRLPFLERDKIVAQTRYEVIGR